MRLNQFDWQLVSQCIVFSKLIRSNCAHWYGKWKLIKNMYKMLALQTNDDNYCWVLTIYLSISAFFGIASTCGIPWMCFKFKYSHFIWLSSIWEYLFYCFFRRCFAHVIPKTPIRQTFPKLNIHKTNAMNQSEWMHSSIRFLTFTHKHTKATI